MSIDELCNEVNQMTLTLKETDGNSQVDGSRENKILETECIRRGTSSGNLLGIVPSVDFLQIKEDGDDKIF